MTRLRPFIAFTLALILMIGSQGMAVARGEGTVAGHMVICAAGGFAVIAIGPDGQPVGTPQICPDAALSLAGAPGLAALPSPTFGMVVAEAARPLPASRIVAPAPLPQARAPPAV